MAVELVDRMGILVAIRPSPGMSDADIRSLRLADSYVRMQHFVRGSTCVPFQRLLGDVRRKFLQRIFAAFHGTLGSHLRDAFQEGSADVVSCVFLGLKHVGFFLSLNDW
jgi:hypothetical protein